MNTVSTPDYGPPTADEPNIILIPRSKIKHTMVIWDYGPPPADATETVEISVAQFQEGLVP